MINVRFSCISSLSILINNNVIDSLASRKRSSPSQNCKTDGTRKKQALQTSTQAAVNKISLEGYVTTDSALKKLANALSYEDLISKKVHLNVTESPSALFTNLLSILQSEVNSTIILENKDNFIRVLREQQDPALKILADKL